jgi:diguanylate cyclase (GGDEF)-like protein
MPSSKKPGLFNWQGSIRWKFAAAFIAVACFVAAFVGVTIAIHFDTVERAAQLEATHVAELIANAAIESDRFRPGLQEYVVQLHSLRKRDVVIVDAAKKGLADAVPAEVGRTFDHDLDNQVGKTISDGQVRTFIEKSDAYPDGAYQIVVPLRQHASVFSQPAMGAVILEYTAIREELLAAERDDLYLMSAAGIVVVLLAASFGLGIARRIAQPLLDLKSSVERIAAQDYGARVVVSSHDEIGLLGTAFNKMAEDLKASQKRVVERTQQLHQSNTLLQEEVGQRSWEATHDVLTGLVNRREFESLVEVSVASARHAGKHHVVCYMDLDQFKVVNDTCGHAAGDDLLKELAGLLQSRIRESDTLARLGGDEFGLLLEGCSLERAQFIAADLLAAVGDFRFNRDAKMFTLGVSIGLAPVTGDSSSSAEAMSMADTACYWAKEQGRNRVCVYHTGDSDMAARRREMGWIARINLALAQDRFTLYHQRYLPLNAAAGTCQHLEVLLRMIDEEGNLVQPGSFLPAAERYNLMPAIDRWVIDSALRFIGALPASAHHLQTCCINLSGSSLTDEHLLQYIQGKLREYEVSPRRVCFEITETATIANMNRALRLIGELRARGCRFALDDFGTGLASFAYLKHLPVDFLKIDGTFVKNIARDPVNLAIVKATNEIGHALGIKTIAEYVEDIETLEALRQLGVDYGQGFGIARPMPLENFHIRALNADVFLDEPAIESTVLVPTLPP